MKNKIFITVIVILSLSVAAIAYAQEGQEGSDRPTIDKRQEMKRQPGKRGGKPPLMKFLKGTFRAKLMVETPDGIKAVRIDRGEVVSVSDTEIEIEESDGRIVTVTIDEDTRFLGKKSGELNAGDKIQSIREKMEGEEYKTRAIISPRDPGKRRELRGQGRQGDRPPPPVEGELF